MQKILKANSITLKINWIIDHREQKIAIETWI